jgi:hypothetical protein
MGKWLKVTKPVNRALSADPKEREHEQLSYTVCKK